MPHHMDKQTIENAWRMFLTQGVAPDFHHLSPLESLLERTFDMRKVARRLPREPRCRLCYVPFGGVGGWIARRYFKRGPSRLNPRMCNICELFAEKYQGGAEVELSIVFADVRGSTSLAEKMSSEEFSQLINRFFRVTTDVMMESDAFIEKFIGDGVTGLYVPGFAGPQHARMAAKAAQSILYATGHADPEGAWIPVGVGVHTGVAFIGAVGQEDGPWDIAALGDAVNIAARLGSQAAPGEALISEETRAAANLPSDSLQSRQLQLRGRNEPVNVWAMRAISLTQ